MADAKASAAAKKAARLNVRPDLGAGYFTDERETWAMGYVAGAAAEREAILRELDTVEKERADLMRWPEDNDEHGFAGELRQRILARQETPDEASRRAERRNNG